MNSVNTIVLTKRDFGTDKALYAALASQLRLLLASGYNCVVSEADPKGGVITVEYASSNILVGDPKPYWLTDPEAVEAQKLHDQIELEEAKAILKQEGSSLLGGLAPDKRDA